MVIVAPLSSLARDALAGLGCQILHTEETRAYRVFHFTAGSAPRETDELREDLSPYIRGSIRFTRGADDYFLETVYSLADFDTLGRHLELAMDVLEDVPAPRSALIWNPGQGHLAAVIARSGSRAMTVAGRDCLECAITARNLLRLGSPPVAVHCLPSESELVGAVPPGSVDLLVSIPHPIPRVPWQDGLAEAARRILKPGGRLIAVGTSTEIHRLISHPGPLAAEGGRKRAGFRAVVLRTPEGPTPPSQA